MIQAIPLRRNQSLGGDIAGQVARMALRPLHLLTATPSIWFLAALTAMLLRHPDVSFYGIDRVAVLLLIVGVAARAALRRQRLFRLERASYPMMGLTALAILSVAGEPFDNQTWCLLAAKFIVPFTLFHLAAIVFVDKNSIRQFEIFSLLVLAYLSFTAIAFLVGAKSLIFPHFILDESLGYQADRARGPLLQAVANGMSLNLLGLLALHSLRRGTLRGLKAWLLLGSLPLAILATMTRAVWLSFAGTLIVLIVRSHSQLLRRVCLGLVFLGIGGIGIAVSSPDFRDSLTDRLQEKGPVEFRRAVYVGGWEMFLERPLSGWGVNQMPAGLARHVNGYKQRLLYPHNTYLELLVEHGLAGLGLYLWLMVELWRLSHHSPPLGERSSFLDLHLRELWPVLLGVYWVNAALVVMNYQFVNGFLLTVAGMLAGQQRRTNTPSTPRAVLC
ncbi:MAG TPA: O-antigen ligase family protein [Candidatus Sulfotelmatobacter sp.]